jgi:ElaB/YqjD/DUF883 family membrane-anchored ribosome-binding protein
MITILAVNCAPILVCSTDDRKTAAETASDEMVMGAVWVLREFSLHVSQQNHSDLFLKALDDPLKQFYQKKGIFCKQKISKSAKAKVDDVLAKESYQLHEQKSHNIRAAMEAVVYGADKDSTTKRRQFQVRLNRTRHAATTWADADCQTGIERLERKIHPVTPAKAKLFDELFESHVRQLLQEIGTKATGPRSKFAKDLARMKADVEDEALGVVNMPANK